MGLMMKTFGQLDLPFYVISAGVTEVIEASFCALIETGEVRRGTPAEKCWEENLHIYSNSFNYCPKTNEAISPVYPLMSVVNK